MSKVYVVIRSIAKDCACSFYDDNSVIKVFDSEQQAITYCDNENAGSQFTDYSYSYESFDLCSSQL